MEGDEREVENVPQLDTADLDDPALPAQEVEALLSNMAKAQRAFNMYRANNPVFHRFQDLLRDSFRQVWERADSLELGVTEDGFRYGGGVFRIGKGRESLSFALYKDGIRSLKFLPGFENEVGRFLDALTRSTRRDAEAEDIITILWEQEIEGLQYGYVDLLVDGLDVPDSGYTDQPPAVDRSSLSLDLQLDVVSPADAPAGQTAQGGAPPPGAPGLTREDFDETVYFLEEREMASLREEVALEAERNLRVDVLSALFDRLEEREWPERQAEILDILNQLVPLFLSRGHLHEATLVLQELHRLGAEGGPLAGDLAEEVERLFARLSDPRVLEQFVQALEDGAVSPDSEDVGLFFSRLHASAMPVLIRFSELTQNAGVEHRLASAINGLAARHPAEVNRLLASDEASIVAGAARAAGRTRLAEAVPGLAGALEHPDRDVRLAVVRALVDMRLTPALQALARALDDEDREVRIAAANALRELRFASAREALAEVIDGRRLRDADLTEKMAFFQAYGAVGGSGAVSRMAGILNDRGFLGRRSPTEERACAALALGEAGTAAAREALQRSREDDDPIVRNAVIRALRREALAG